MEAAILEEAEHPELADIDSAARQAESLLDTTWERVTEEFEKSDGVRIGTDLSIVSVGEATRSGERAVRVPLVLGDSRRQHRQPGADDTARSPDGRRLRSMRKRIGIYGAAEEAFQLIPMLLANPGVEITAVVDPGAPALRARRHVYDPDVARVLDSALTEDPTVLTDDPRRCMR